MARRRLSLPTPEEAALFTADIPHDLEKKSLGGPFRAPPIADMAGAAAAMAALEEMIDMVAEARDEGRMVQALPLEAVVEDHLVRDRIALDPDEMAALRESLRARGQQTPIEVEALGEGRYGLISGWRRLQALRQLRAEEGGEGRFATIQALMRRPAEAAAAYVAMVEENEIRAGLSFYERARIVVRAVEAGVFADEKAALRGLFGAIPRARRSKIGSFAALVRALDGALRFPQAISEKLGLQLAGALESDAGLAARIARALTAAPPPDAAAETALLKRLLSSPPPAAGALDAPDEPRPGIRLSPLGRGGLRLEGPGVTAEFRARLLAWLSENSH